MPIQQPQAQQPQTISQILDSGVSYYRNYFRQFYLLAFAIMAVGWSSYLYDTLFADVSQDVSLFEMIAGAVCFIITLMLELALIYQALACVKGQFVSPRPAVRKGLYLLPHTILALIFIFIMSLLFVALIGLVAFIVSSLSKGLGIVVAAVILVGICGFIYFLTRFSFFMVALLLMKKPRIWASFKHSWQIIHSVSECLRVLAVVGVAQTIYVVLLILPVMVVGSFVMALDWMLGLGLASVAADVSLNFGQGFLAILAWVVLCALAALWVPLYNLMFVTLYQDSLTRHPGKDVV